MTAVIKRERNHRHCIRLAGVVDRHSFFDGLDGLDGFGFGLDGLELGNLGIGWAWAMEKLK